MLLKSINYPKFDRPFDIHTDASDRQLGSVISQDGKPLAFYSRKLSIVHRGIIPLLNKNYYKYCGDSEGIEKYSIRTDHQSAYRS